MTFNLHFPATLTTPDESAFSIRDDDGEGVRIHPWNLGDRRNSSEVSIIVGNLDGFDAEEGDHTDEFDITIVDREEFIVGLLAVFPELGRS